MNIMLFGEKLIVAKKRDIQENSRLMLMVNI